MHHILAAIAAGVRVALLHGKGIFCGENKAAALFAGELSSQFLGTAVRIVAGGIDEIAAQVDISIKDAARIRLLGPPGFTEGHGTEGQRRNAQAGTAK